MLLRKLGKTEEAEKYRKIAEEIKNEYIAVNSRFRY